MRGALPDKLRDALKAESVNPVDRRRVELSDALDAVCTRSGIQNKELAFHWKCDEGLASRMRTGLRPLPDHRMAQLPEWLDDEVVAEHARMRGLLVGPAAAAANALIGLAQLIGFAVSPALDAIPLRMAHVSDATAHVGIAAAEPKRRRV